MSISQEQLNPLTNAIHSLPELRGVMIGLYDDLRCTIADPGSTPAIAFSEIAVIIEVVDESQNSVEYSDVPSTVTVPPAEITNRSRVWSELRGAGLSCGFAVVAGVGVLGSAAAEVPSGGTSTFLLVVSWVGLATSGIQCLNGIARSVEAVRNPDSSSLANLDQNRVYNIASLVVDGLGLAAGLASLPASYKNLMAILERRGGLMTAEELSKLGREAKAKAIQQALAKASRDPDTAKVLDKALKEALSARTMSRVTAGNSVIVARNAGKIQSVIEQETARRLIRAVMSVMAAPAGATASSMSSETVGSASGAANLILHTVGLNV